jgi:2-phospho-L-lactate guanylyltransferase
MINWALIPVKSFDVGKSRLRKVFSLEELILLNISLFQSTFLKVKDSGQFDHILVVSRDKSALAWAEANRGECLLEVGNETLNSALTQGVSDLCALETYHPEDPGMLIVPDHAQLGTNALMLTRPDLLTPQFGANSFQLHCKQAEQLHLHQIIYLNRHLQQDIDTPEDLVLIQKSYLLNSPIAS